MNERRHFFGLIRCDDDEFNPEDPLEFDRCTFSWTARLVPIFLLAILLAIFSIHATKP